jgi:uncharacterized protein YfaS (alpha-2-macroglobulin family)
MDFLLKGLQEGVTGLPAVKPQGTAGADSVWNDVHYAGSGRFAVLSYGAYVLARESKAPVSTLRQLYESRGNAHSGLSLVQLGIALRLMGDEARGDTAISEGVLRGRDNGYWWGDYGSPLRDAALSYALLDRHKIKTGGKESLLAIVAKEMEHPNNYYYYFSTQEKLALFLIGNSFAAGDSGTWTAELNIHGKAEPVSAAGSLFRSLQSADLAAGVKLTNTHKERLFIELAMDGYPVKSPPARNDAISLQREMFDPEGQVIGNRPLKVGETVIVRLQVQNKVRMANALVVDHIPAGLEVENLNIVQGEQMGAVKFGGLNPAEVMADRRIQHVEYRDDRFVAAVKLYGQLTLFYRARVVTPGKFVVPPLYSEDMYRPETFGLSEAGGTLTVVDSRSGAAKE